MREILISSIGKFDLNLKGKFLISATTKCLKVFKETSAKFFQNLYIPQHPLQSSLTTSIENTSTHDGIDTEPVVELKVYSQDKSIAANGGYDGNRNIVSSLLGLFVGTNVLYAGHSRKDINDIYQLNPKHFCNWVGIFRSVINIQWNH